MTSRILAWPRLHPLAVYFFLAYGISWSVEVPLALKAQRLIPLRIPFSIHYLAAYGPMLAAVIAVSLTNGANGRKDLLARLLKWRVQPVWWLIAVSPLVLYMFVALMLRFVRGQWSALGFPGQIDFVPHLGLAAPFFWLLTFGIGEETGWRGYALPRLQKNRSAFSATVILWILWALWHLPAFFYLYDPKIAPGFLLGVLAGAITFTWLYNSTGGSILIVAVWHGMFDLTTKKCRSLSKLARQRLLSRSVRDHSWLSKAVLYRNNSEFMSLIRCDIFWTMRKAKEGSS